MKFIDMPFGEQIHVSLSGTKDRLSFIGKENDVESGLGDFGVRKYDDAAGRCIIIAEIQDFNC